MFIFHRSSCNETWENISGKFYFCKALSHRENIGETTLYVLWSETVCRAQVKTGKQKMVECLPVWHRTLISVSCFFFSALRMHKRNNFYTNTLHLVTCWDAVHTTIFNHTREFVEGCSRDGLKHVKNHVRVSSCVMEGVDCVHLVSWCNETDTECTLQSPLVGKHRLGIREGKPNWLLTHFWGFGTSESTLSDAV